MFSWVNLLPLYLVVRYLKYAQKPYQYFADAYIMANQDWFDSLPADLQDLVMEVGAEVGALATNTILDAGENTLKKFAERGNWNSTKISGIFHAHLG